MTVISWTIENNVYLELTRPARHRGAKNLYYEKQIRIIGSGSGAFGCVSDHIREREQVQ